MIVFPLYANLATEKQKQVFQIPPENVRHCIIATNVAETSITIPNVKYVIDTGKVKQRLYDSHSSATTFDICWCSKASAEQRAGRSGRIGPGYCYRLYSSVVFQYDMPDFTKPDILRQPLESVLLQMKCLGIAKVEDFPFPTSPSRDAIVNSENLLIAIGALEKKEVIDTNTCAVPTKLGIEMGKLPISPRFSVMLLK
ncbi:uncharacterized protein, partial [Pempheris klunzingeri]|uniref:uncharacterized protein n=1 Tax=Pempheris klunzingeri TaxID=3127111 RepID=UPI00397E9DD7